MKIPQHFSLMGREIEVIWLDDLEDKGEAAGRASWKRGEIELQEPKKDADRAYVEQAFLHELVHLILWAMSEDDLSENERFVDLFGGLLHQAMVTGE